MFKLKLSRKESGKRRARRPTQDRDRASGPILPAAAGTFLAILAIVLAFVAIAMTLVNLDYFKVRDLETQGAEGLDSFRREDFLKSVRGRNIFSVDIDDMSGAITRRYPDAKSVSVRRRLPDVISITIVLRRPIALLGGDKYYPVDRDGLILPNADAGLWKRLPIISGIDLKASDKAGRICESKALKSAINLIVEMDRARLSYDYNVTAIDVSDQRNISFFLEDGLEVKIGHDNFRERLLRLSETLKNSKIVLSRIKYIDLRFKDVVIGQR